MYCHIAILAVERRNRDVRGQSTGAIARTEIVGLACVGRIALLPSHSGQGFHHTVAFAVGYANHGGADQFIESGRSSDSDLAFKE